MDKGKLTGLLRKAGLMHLADSLRFTVLRHRSRALNRAFRQAHPAVVLPPDYLMYESFRLDYSKYYLGGRQAAEWVRDQLARFISLQGKDILDWGCGPGRVIRHLPQVMGGSNRYTGTDYNPQTVAWCRAHLPGITFLQNQLAPPIPMPAASVDALYGISIFTHLSLANHIAWFEELLRVLKPGGILLLTTQGEAFRGILTPAEQVLFDRGELVERSNVTEGHRVFSAFQPVSFLHKLFLPQAEVLDFSAGHLQEHTPSQDVWLLRKRESANAELHSCNTLILG